MFKDYLTVNDGENFKFGSVIYNQTHDSHPPLFLYGSTHDKLMFSRGIQQMVWIDSNLIYYLITIVFFI